MLCTIRTDDVIYITSGTNEMYEIDLKKIVKITIFHTDDEITVYLRAKKPASFESIVLENLALLGSNTCSFHEYNITNNLMYLPEKAYICKGCMHANLYGGYRKEGLAIRNTPMGLIIRFEDDEKKKFRVPFGSLGSPFIKMERDEKNFVEFLEFQMSTSEFFSQFSQKQGILLRSILELLGLMQNSTLTASKNLILL